MQRLGLRVVPGVAAFLLLSAMLCGTPSADSTPLPTPASPVPTLTALNEPTATGEAQTPATEPAAALSDTGPWLVTMTRENELHWARVWAMNPDGSALTPLTENFILGGLDRPMEAAVSPGGGHIAYVEASDSIQETALHLISLPGGEDRVITLLLNEASLPRGDASTTQAYQEVLDSASLAWSPDWRRLAFVGAQDGPSADLYVYSMDDGSITRLTSGDTHAHAPVWSPDGQIIVHSAYGSVEAPQGHWLVDTVWAARADGSAVKALYQPPGSTAERYAGWIDDRTLLVYTQNASGNLENLRALNIETGAVRVLWAGALDAAGANSPAVLALDPDRGRVLFAANSYASQPAPQPGLYRLDVTDGGDAILVMPYTMGIWDLRWLPSVGRYVGYTGSEWFQLVPDDLPATTPTLLSGPAAWAGPAVAPDGSAWAWADVTALWFGEIDDTELTRVVEGEYINWALWSPDSQQLFFPNGNRIYVVDRAGLQVREVGSVGDVPVHWPTGAAWLEP